MALLLSPLLLNDGAVGDGTVTRDHHDAAADVVAIRLVLALLNTLPTAQKQQPP